MGFLLEMLRKALQGTSRAKEMGVVLLKKS